MNYKKTYKQIGVQKNNRIKEIKSAKKFLIFSNFLFIVGLFFSVYLILYSVKLNFLDGDNFVKPFSGSVLGLVYKENTNFTFSELQNVSNSPSIIRVVDTPKNFKLSIPKLNIFDALVTVDESTLDPADSIGHYKGTALPGEVGNSFLYGHSSLPFFYNPNDYKTIFTKVPTLKNEDKIYIKIGDKKLTYSVKLGRELKPTEVDPYASYYPAGFNKSTITLMTCTPPGTKNYRYILVAELVRTINSVN